MEELMKNRKVLFIALEMLERVFDYIIKGKWIVEGKVVKECSIKPMGKSGFVIIKPI